MTTFLRGGIITNSAGTSGVCAPVLALFLHKSVRRESQEPFTFCHLCRSEKNIVLPQTPLNVVCSLILDDSIFFCWWTRSHTRQLKKTRTSFMLAQTNQFFLDHSMKPRRRTVIKQTPIDYHPSYLFRQFTISAQKKMEQPAAKPMQRVRCCISSTRHGCIG